VSRLIRSTRARSAKGKPQTRSVDAVRAMDRTDGPQLPLILPIPTSASLAGGAPNGESRRTPAPEENKELPKALDQILTTRKVVEIVGHHRSTLYRWMCVGHFPKKHAFRGRKVGWLRSEVEKWLAGDGPESS
jgi:predicted DNA-binding transcriptional regulator AlpA